MSIKPLMEYLESKESLRQGKAPEAGRLLESAVRSPAKNPVLRRSLETLLNHRSLAGQALLNLIRVEANRRVR